MDTRPDKVVGRAVDKEVDKVIDKVVDIEEDTMDTMDSLGCIVVGIVVGTVVVVAVSYKDLPFRIHHKGIEAIHYILGEDIVEVEVEDNSSKRLNLQLDGSVDS